MKVLVIGSGGREHAIVKACLNSTLVTSVIAAPGNGGIAAETTCLPLDVEDIRATVALAQNERVEFVIVGPEVPLSLGVVDALAAVGIPAYGPNKAGARLEASKVYTKQFLEKYGIPTAAGKSFTEVQAALDYLSSQSFPIVLKASGLAAGKGVIIAQTFEEAAATASEMLEGDKFGASGEEILIERFMQGEEASIMLMVSGRNYVQLPASQDHKRIGEGDTGPNTGGMGAYAPAALVTPALNRQIAEQIIQPTLDGLVAEGIDYRGTLYIGIMIEAEQAKVVEFNVRFGDPECQILLPLLKQDPIQLMLDCVRGTLNPATVEITSEHIMIVVLAAAGYPESYAKGDTIRFPTDIPANCSIVHAGTQRTEDGRIVTAGGRVLGIVGKGASLQEARDAAYNLCEQVSFDGAYYRCDIGHRQLSRHSD